MASDDPEVAGSAQDQMETEPDYDDQDNGDGASSSAESEPVETLIAGRARRTTAGNRMSQLIGQEEQAGEDDDVALLFADTGEEDIEFEDPDENERSDDGQGAERAYDDGDDEDDDSSTDEEDKGPGVGDDELDGEKQLQKEERAAKRAEKRKAMVKPIAVRKRVKIDERSVEQQKEDEAARARKRKKSERVSWLPAVDDAPTRTSSRTLSVQNKERTMASMKVSDARRAQIIKNMEVASQKKKRERARPMTQEERLAEAARVEEVNTKSLTHWEEMEKERLDRQRAKLEALQNRVLEGPVIRWYSGPAIKVGGTVTMLGSQSVVKEIVTSQNDTDPPKERKYQRKNKKPKDEPPADPSAPPAQDISEPQNEQIATAEAGGFNVPPSGEVPQGDTSQSLGQENSDRKMNLDPADDAGKPSDTQTEGDATVAQGVSQNDAEPTLSIPDETPTETPNVEHAREIQSRPTDGEDDGTRETPHTSRPPDVEMQDSNLGVAEVKVDDEETHAAPLAQSQESSQAASVTPAIDHKGAEDANELIDAATSSTTAATTQNPNENPLQSQPIIQAPDGTTTDTNTPVPIPPHDDPSSTPATAPPQAPPPEPIHTNQQTITLLEFSESALNSTDASRRILFDTPPSTKSTPTHPLDAFIRPPKPVPQTCVITGAPARHRDPATGLPYADRTAYAMIQRVVRGECRWSNLLGAWVGADVEQVEGERRDVANGVDVALVGIGGTRAARGVPLGFIDAAHVRKIESGKGEEQVVAETTATAVAPSI